MTNPIIAFQNVSKVFEDSGTQVLKDINFELEEGKFYTLLGASGSGKSTILNIIAGLLDATSGDVLLDGKRINDIPINKRDVHTVFQSYALFPHMNVFDNVAFALKLKKVPKKEIEERVEEALKMVQLDGYQKRSIQKLSGGQRQRVAIARAIINQPRVVLLDEPLSALDLKLRTEMQYELRELQQRLGITFVFVTHDQEEALAMSDWIFVMNDGEIVQSGTPVDIYDEPINHFVATFIGESNILPGVMIWLSSMGNASNLLMEECVLTNLLKWLSVLKIYKSRFLKKGSCKFEWKRNSSVGFTMKLLLMIILAMNG